MAGEGTEASDEAVAGKEDFLQQGFSKMMASFSDYHSEGGPKDNSLKELAAAVATGASPALGSSSSRRTEQKPPREAAAGKGRKKGESSQPPRIMVQQAALEAEDNDKQRKSREKKGPRTAGIEGAAEAEEPRGPVPAPFAGAAPAASSLAPCASKHSGGPKGKKKQASAPALDMPAPEEAQADGEVKPEDYEKWAAYYRQCADYFSQCSDALAAQQDPSSISISSGKPAAGAVPAAAQAASSVAAAGFGAAAHSLPGAAAGPSFTHAQLPPSSGATTYSQQVPSASAPLPGPSGLQPGMLPPGGAAVAAQGDEVLANLLMAWYFSGYYTGLYAARSKG
mmetsp:Transcript_51515/g.122501  ORF Transcript_51515/g.122501 Transcript_51515/m.122501 type:complete len:339 (+) Transcript_51515:61-1077(+)